MLIAIAGIAGLGLAAFAGLLLVSGAYKPAEYLEPWQKNTARQFDDPRVRLTAHGLLAASGHNMQPWKIKLDDSDPLAFYLYADSERLSEQADPLSRQMMVSQGTFLEYVRVAGRQLGYETSVTLFPYGGYDEGNLRASMDAKPAARIELEQTDPQSEPLYDFLFLPDTNRLAYQLDKLTLKEVKTLERLSVGGGITVKVYQDEEDVRKLGSYALRAAAIEAGVSRVMEEAGVIFRANEREKNSDRYGFSVEGQGTSGIMRHVVQALVTLFPSMNTGQAAADRYVRTAEESVSGTSAYVMILSSGNSRTSQIESGMTYSQLILEAHRLGLAMQPLSQALEEYAEMKELYDGIHREYAPGGETIQMLVRIGRPTREVPQTMRRDVRELIVEN
ncbi:hypothetical protein NYE69_25090 [Paenibacillus sp. FSL R5-0527]|uniref:Acg family FMN-binding oxidoreductase n=1 Tax=Paenibacillus sp. FSL R5-0527 TaxID=2975321 RepID=UPI00268DC820